MPIIYDDREVLEALNDLSVTLSDLSPIMQSIGEHLTESTKRRFSDMKTPEGERWEANSAATLEYKVGSRPLTGETGVLGDTINYQLPDKSSVEIGSPMVYAAMQQFGGTREEFPWLWGDIPARPFLGISEEDGVEILDILREGLEA